MAQTFSKSAYFFLQTQRFGANIFKVRLFFPSDAKVWRKHFQSPPILSFRRKGLAQTFSKSAYFFLQTQRFGASIFKVRLFFPSDAKVCRKHFQSPPIFSSDANNFKKRLGFHLFQTCRNFSSVFVSTSKVRYARSKAKFQKQKQKAACVPLELSKIPLKKECKKLIISSSPPHHHFMLSIPPFPPSKVHPHPLLFSKGGHDNTKGHKNAMVCEAVAIVRGGCRDPSRHFFLPIATTSNKNF